MEGTNTVSQAASEHDQGIRHSVFWRVAGILVGVQVTTGLLAVVLSAWFAYDQALNLVANSLRLRFDSLAEEVEQRLGPTMVEGLATLPRTLQMDLAARFPDPVIVLGASGEVLQRIVPNPDRFEIALSDPPEGLPLPPNLPDFLLAGDVMIQLDTNAPGGTWGLAPVYDAGGGLMGGLLVHPLTNSRNREVAGTRAAFIRALYVVMALAVAIALLLGAFFTWGLVRPLRRMALSVERIGSGDYSSRLPDERSGEFGRLSTAINQMATDVEQSIEALRTADQLRRELIANIGHDLRTPLAALLGYVEEGERYLQEGEKDASREALETALRQGHYLSQLVADLFELSVLDSGQAPLRREPIPLAELLTDAAHRHGANFRKAQITFTVNLSSSLPIFYGDAVRLLRVMDNLLSNARHHTPEGGQVILAAAVEDHSIVVTVQDNGPGMPEDVLDNIFERYYRGTDARTRKTRGTGLGLPISRAIARAHGGDLTATSQLGEGSTFILTLP